MLGGEEEIIAILLQYKKCRNKIAELFAQSEKE